MEEKSRRRAARETQEHELQIAERRRRIRAIAALVALVAIGVAASAAVIIGRGDGSDPTLASQATATDPFGPHYAGLVQRRRAANVPTMMDTMKSSVHFHPRLKVFVEGRQIVVPTNIGIDPAVDPMQMAGLHTHDTSGTIHVEGMAGARLGQFFAIWGVPLSSSRLGPYRARGDNAVQMWVDGKPSSASGQLKLADGQRIVVSFGPKGAPAPTA